jgi:hypothetical protein
MYVSDYSIIIIIFRLNNIVSLSFMIDYVNDVSCPICISNELSSQFSIMQPFSYKRKPSVSEYMRHLIG